MKPKEKTLQQQITEAILKRSPASIVKRLERLSVMATYQLAEAFGVKHDGPDYGSRLRPPRKLPAK